MSRLIPILLIHENEHRRTSQLALALLALLCFAGHATAQPTSDRLPTTWHGTNQNEYWRIQDDGARKPGLSGLYRSNSITYNLLPAVFNFRDNTYRTRAIAITVGITNQMPMVIEYSSAGDESYIVYAKVRGVTVAFYAEGE